MVPEDRSERKFPRRVFLSSLAGSAALAALKSALSQDSLVILKPGNFERLRLDFNAGRNKVRLLTVLSPT